MYAKKMFFISALALGLAVSTANSTANAQEQTNTDEQVAQAVTEAVDETTPEAITEAVTEAMPETMPEAEADTAPEVMVAKPSGPEGMWIRRKNGEQVRAEFRDDALYCTIINRKKKSGKAKKDFEMCHGMTAVEGAWKGKKMKHPIAPKFMNFKGTVTVDGDVLKIKGCAGFCDSEEWDRAPAEG